MCPKRTVLRILVLLPSLMIRDQKFWYYSFPKITPRKDVFSSWYLYILLKQTLWTMENPFHMPHMWHWIPMWENFIQHKLNVMQIMEKRCNIWLSYVTKPNLTQKDKEWISKFYGIMLKLSPVWYRKKVQMPRI